MIRVQKLQVNIVRNLVLLLTIWLPLQAPAESLDLARVPLIDAVAPEVRPNLMFILDNSGSMGQDYTPDYLSDIFGTPADNDRQCKDSGDNDGDTNVRTGAGTGTGTGANRFLDLCVPGDPVYFSSDMNNQYYNPELTYLPGVNANGISLQSQTSGNTGNFTSVKTDPYLRQQTNLLRDGQVNTNLTTEFPDRLWCSVQNPTVAQRLDTAICRRNVDYTYPDATFRFGRLSTNSNPNQQVTAGMLDSVVYTFGRPYYYKVIPTEYCSDSTLRNCSSTPTGAFMFPAKSRWCDSVALTNCQSINTEVFKFPRYVGTTGFAGVAAVGRIQVTNAGTGTSSMTSLTVNGVQIMGGTAAGCGVASSNSSSGTASTRRILLANAIVARINSCVSNPEYTAVSDGVSNPTITITSTAAAGATGNGAIARSGVNNSIINVTANAAGGVTAIAARAPYTFTRVDITPTTTTYPKVTARADCSGAIGPNGCTFQEEMTNFANWYSYHRTRMQGMKTAASLAFKDIGGEFRVGFITIANQSTNYIPVKRFINGGPREDWYTKLFSIVPSTSTPLRSALSLVGRIYAGEQLFGRPDPIEYACQANYALLTTDGYWNTDTDANVLGLANVEVGNVDGGSTQPPKKEDPANPQKNTLADVAKYFLDKDLREGTNCNGALNEDVCGGDPSDGKEDPFEKQTMRTFTLGLGIDGTLNYSPTYKSDTTGDFAEVRADLPGGKKWPRPIENQATTIDDLWHAAVNGDGDYFSAKDTSQLVNGLKSALKAITVTTGSASAASTSTLTPTQGDNDVFRPSFTSVKWTGNLIANKLTLKPIKISESPTWCAEPISGDECPGVLESDTQPVNGVIRTFCKTTAFTNGNNEKECSQGNLQPDDTTCKQEVTASCVGTLNEQTKGQTLTKHLARTIYMNSGGNLTNFEFSNLSGTQQAFFSASHLSAANRLSQWVLLSPTQRTKAVGANLVNFIKGDKTFEDNSLNPPDNRLFRTRESILGDIVGSAPEFIGPPSKIFLDAGYEGFKLQQKDRKAMVYVGANDGMFHAFNAETGKEEWAFVPTEVIKHLWKLADKDYANKHDFYVNGLSAAADVCIAADCANASPSDWRTIIVGSLGRGGRGYFALDVTDPDSPELLWEFNASASGVGDSNLGYTFGRPNFTKKQDGKWVVLLTSGYNNIPENVSASPLPGEVPTGDTPYTTGDGKGYLYVVEVLNGNIIGNPISTNEGSPTSPSNLAHTAAFSKDPLRDKTAEFVYAGDLNGNLWRFDINTEEVLKLTSFRNGNGKVQPISVPPITSTIDGKRVIFVGTGQYLQSSDRTNEDIQTIYAFKDDGDVTISNPRGQMVEQTITVSGETRSSTSDAEVNFSTDLGWFVDLPEPGERQNIPGNLISGTLSISTNVPTGSTCEPDGFGYDNSFNFKTGRAVFEDGITSNRTSTQTVGQFILEDKDGNKSKGRLGSDGDLTFSPVPTKTGSSGFQTNRAIWRELSPPPEE